MTKVNLDTIKPWVTRQVTQLLGFEDDVVIEFIFNQLEERVSFLEIFDTLDVVYCVYEGSLNTYSVKCNEIKQNNWYNILSTYQMESVVLHCCKICHELHRTQFLKKYLFFFVNELVCRV